MDRRGFMRTLIGGVAAVAAVRTFPFRVFSFPTEILKPPLMVHISEVATWDEITTATLEGLRQDILYDNFFVDSPWLKKLRRQGQAIDTEILESTFCINPSPLVIP